MGLTPVPSPNTRPRSAYKCSFYLPLLEGVFTRPFPDLLPVVPGRFDGAGLGDGRGKGLLPPGELDVAIYYSCGRYSSEFVPLMKV